MDRGLTSVCLWEVFSLDYKFSWCSKALNQMELSSINRAISAGCNIAVVLVAIFAKESQMRVLSLLVAGFLISSSAAYAGPLTLSNFTGGWDAGSVDADAGAAPTVDVTNQGGSSVDTIEWGTGVDNSGLQSGYTFDLVDGSFDPIMDDPFVLGDFTHINNTITAATAGFTGVDYDLAFNTNGAPPNVDNTLSFTHLETLNAGPCPEGVVPCPDIVTVTVVDLTTMFITVGTDVYLFEILGFSEDGVTFTDKFVSAEGGTNSAQLWARVSLSENEVPEVPEPASLILLGSGLVLVARQVQVRRRNRKG